ncbi:WXG100 family type VII secretion target, partial [Kineosporia sp. NBRC 101677]|uniref:WXG100 family type VII secretion target n=1 Tax=Kineosporia sp. NBRC 101677 TaxID=3032197 RepID=UPI002555568D
MRDFLAGLGMRPPQADSDLLREVGELYLGAAREVEQLRVLVLQTIVEVGAGWSGEAAEAFLDQLRPFVVVDGSSPSGRGDFLGVAVEIIDTLGFFAGDLGVKVDYLNLSIISNLVVALAEILFWMALAYWFPGAMQHVFLVRWLTKLGVNRQIAVLISTIVTMVAVETLVSLAVDVVVQLKLKGDGLLEGWLGQETGGALTFGLMSGLVGGFVFGVGGGLIHVLGKAFGDDLAGRLGKDLRGLFERVALPGGAGGKEFTDALARVFGDVSHSLITGFGRKSPGGGGSGVRGLSGGAGRAPGGVGRPGGGELFLDVLARNSDRLGAAQTRSLADAYRRLVGDESPSVGARGAGPGAGAGAGAAARGLDEAAREFVEAMARTFERLAGRALGGQLARDLGRDYADVFVRHWSRHGVLALKSDLRLLLRDFEGPLGAGTVRMLSDEVVDVLLGNLRRNFSGTLGYKLGALSGTGLLEGVTGTLSTGFYNLLVGPNKRFETEAGAFAGGVVLGMAAQAGHFWGVDPIQLRNLPSLKELQAGLGADPHTLADIGTSTGTGTGTGTGNGASGAPGPEARDGVPEPDIEPADQDPGTGGDVGGSGDGGGPRGGGSRGGVDAARPPAPEHRGPGGMDWPVPTVGGQNAARPYAGAFPDTDTTPLLSDQNIVDASSVTSIPSNDDGLGSETSSLYGTRPPAINPTGPSNTTGSNPVHEPPHATGILVGNGPESVRLADGFEILGPGGPAMVVNNGGEGLVGEEKAVPGPADPADPVVSAPVPEGGSFGGSGALHARREHLMALVTETYRERLVLEERFEVVAREPRERLRQLVEERLDKSAAEAPQGGMDKNVLFDRLWAEVQPGLRSEFLTEPSNFQSYEGIGRWREHVESVLSQVPDKIDAALSAEADAPHPSASDGSSRDQPSVESSGPNIDAARQPDQEVFDENRSALNLPP